MEIYKDFYVITGASKGLGAAVSIEIASEKSILLLISRDKEKLYNIAQKCEEKGALVHLLIDDISSETFIDKIKLCFVKILNKKINKIVLINNASIIEPIKKLVNLSKVEQKSLLDINLTSTILLTSEFLRLSQLKSPTETFIINISSGVSVKPVSGWSLYCISKSGINMLSSCIAEETSDWPNKVYSLSINPGAMNTDMQKKIRESNKCESPIAERFIKMYQDGNLSQTENVAKQILQIMTQKTFVNGEFIDFNQMKR
jgi:benzil reductase ((S)-benzoin forming)